MTEEEVNLIYEYLHENYEYRDGELISKKTNRPIGTICVQNNSIYLYWQIRIKNKATSFLVKSLIYIFHYKKYNRFFDFKDKNPMNLRIENLIPIDSRRRVGRGVTKSKNAFRVTICINRKTLYIASFYDEKIAEKAAEYANNLIDSGEEFEQAKELVIKKYCNYLYKSKRKLPVGVYERKNKKNIIYFSKIGKLFCGKFTTPEEAHAAYLKAKEEYKNG